MQNINIILRNRLEKVEKSHKKTQYRILNEKGEIYSQFLGFVELNNEVYGHLFDYNQINVVKEVLKENGFNDIIIKRDKLGSLFVLAAESPFGNPIKLLKLTLFTVFFIPLFLFSFKFASNFISVENDSKVESNENTIWNIGSNLLNHMEGENDK